MYLESDVEKGERGRICVLRGVSNRNPVNRCHLQRKNSPPETRAGKRKRERVMCQSGSSIADTVKSTKN